MYTLEALRVVTGDAHFSDIAAGIEDVLNEVARGHIFLEANAVYSLQRSHEICEREAILYFAREGRLDCVYRR